MRVQVGVDVYFPSNTKTETVYHYGWDPNTGTTTTTSEQVTPRSSYPVVHVKLAF